MATAPRRTEEQDLLAQRVADGEASAEDLADFKALAAEDPALAAQVSAAREESSHLRRALLAASDDVDFRAMQARVFQGMDAPAHGPATGLWARLTAARLPWLWPTLAAATAAGLALIIPALTPEPASVPQELANGGVIELHSLDTGDATAVVFQAPTSGATVIWVAESEVEDEDEPEDTGTEALALPDEVASEVGERVESVTQ